MRIAPRAQQSVGDINPFTMLLRFCSLAPLCLPRDLKANELRLTLIPLVEYYL